MPTLNNYRIPDIVDSVFVQSEAVVAVRSVHEQSYIIPYTVKHSLYYQLTHPYYLESFSNTDFISSSVRGLILACCPRGYKVKGQRVSSLDGQP